MFTNEKTTQIAAYLLSKAGGRLNYTAFLKLLYMADKKMLLDWGIPMTYDKWFCMPLGPVLSNTYNLIRSAHDASSYWGKYILTVDYDIILIALPEDDLLSEAEEDAIDAVFAEHGTKHWQTLVKFTHSFPEWSDPNGSSRLMTYEEVLEVEGFPRDIIDEIICNIGFDNASLDSLVGTYLPLVG